MPVGPVRSLLLALSLALGPCPPCRADDPAPALAAAIRRIIDAPRFAAATWGIKVVSLDSGRVLFEHNAGKYFVPASNTKLFTAAMALQVLGPELRIRTSLYAAAEPGPDGALAGDLILYGRGDPTLMRPWNGGPYRPDPLEALARQLQDRGVRTIRGDLVGDDSYFDAPPYGPGWEWEDLRFAYGADPTALTLHHDVVDVWVYPARGCRAGPASCSPSRGRAWPASAARPPLARPGRSGRCGSTAGPANPPSACPAAWPPAPPRSG